MIDMDALCGTKAWRLEEEKDGIFLLVFDLPGEKVNKLSSRVMEDLERVLDALDKDAAVKAVVIWGGKPDSGTFIAGADIHEILGVHQADVAASQSRRGQEILGRLATMRPLTVAAIHGTCLGGGTELALACDLRIASDSPRTRMGLPEVQLGILPGFGGTQRLPRLVGLARALPVILQGRPLDVRAAAKLGLVDGVSYPGLLRRDAVALANRALAQGGKRFRPRRPVSPWYLRLVERLGPGRRLIAKQARKGVTRSVGTLYPAPFKALEAAVEGLSLSLSDGLALEAKLVGELIASDTSKNLMRLFLASEDARRGPRPAAGAAAGRSAPGSDVVRRVAVLGAGVMGGGIAALFAKSGFRVRLKDIRQEALQTALSSAAEQYATLVRKRRLKRSDAQNYLAAISATTELVGFQSAGVVVEAVVESLEVKKAVLAEMESVVGPGALLATNTSSLSVSEIQSALRRPDRAVGFHFFNPVHRMPLIEVVRGRSTSEETLREAEDLARSIGKIPVRVEDAPGFLVNRLLFPYLSEAVRLFEAGDPFPEVDRALRAFGMPMGPFELLDEVGLDVASKVADVLHAAFGERARPAGSMAALLKEKKLLGKKSGRGFYLHSPGHKGAPRPNPEVVATQIRDRAAVTESDRERWVRSTVFPLINEAARALEEKVVEAAATVDLAMVLGTGFAPMRGGPLRYADTLGVKAVVKFLEASGEARLAPSPLLLRLAGESGRFHDLEPSSVEAAAR